MDEPTTAGWSTNETRTRIMAVEVDEPEARKLTGLLPFANLPTESRLEYFNLD